MNPITQCELIRDIVTNKVTYFTGQVITQANSDWGILCLINVVNNVVNWILVFALVIATLMIVAAGVIAMKDTATAGKIIAATLIGIVIIFLANLIPAVITGILL